jgi:triacylglycerol esterase/lipase EstA (alpha/beta hydrolase family)
VAVSASSAKPNLGMLTLEPLRALIEYARMSCANDAAPTGDGHAIVLFPGLGADHKYMVPLAKHCERLGYAAYHWGRGRNTGPAGNPLEWVGELAGDVSAMVGREHASMTLVGWSLGGIYAREVAKALAPRVRQVITLGSPFARVADSTNVQWLFELLNGRTGRIDARLARTLRTAPPVPTTSIYSRSDGVVAWQACVGEPGPCVENIEVKSSHLGLVWHPEVFRIVADRLAQRRGEWRPWRGRSSTRAGDMAPA